MTGIAYTVNGQPILLWPTTTEVYDEEGNPTGETTDNLEQLISTLPPGTEYELIKEEETISWLAQHKPAPTADEVRAQRDALMKPTDYPMMPDYPISEEARAELMVYRQALRDVPEQAGFPENVVWPDRPQWL